MSEERYVEHNLGEPYMVGDHLALDLINTQARLNNAIYEFWHSDEDIARWLPRVGVVGQDGEPLPAVPGLLEQAKQLREIARTLIMQRKSGQQGDVSGLNRFLRENPTFPQIDWGSDGAIKLSRRSAQQTPTQLLGHVAEAVAQLLTEGDFGLVKECEHPECVMWFYDRTKAHKRRWCSMALCGNRHKAAQFRKRSASAAA